MVPRTYSAYFAKRNCSACMPLAFRAARPIHKAKARVPRTSRGPTRRGARGRREPINSSSSSGKGDFGFAVSPRGAGVDHDPANPGGAAARGASTARYPERAAGSDQRAARREQRAAGGEWRDAQAIVEADGVVRSGEADGVVRLREADGVVRSRAESRAGLLRRTARTLGDHRSAAP